MHTLACRYERAHRRIELAVDWSRTEVDLAIADYLAMLSKDLRGDDYNKTAHRRALSLLLDNRSDGSIERKHQNISAVLISLGYPYIDGYKPLGNYQGLLHERVAAILSIDQVISDVVRAAVDKPAVDAVVTDILGRLVEPPASSDWVYPVSGERAPRDPIPRRVNYLEREARNASLGLAGERFVVDFERARLAHSGRERLAERVEHVSVALGDGLGFDVRSFEPDGSDRLIEVKTTAGGKQTPFFLSRNEVEVSRGSEDAYHLYRVFAFRRDPRLFTVRGALDRVCTLDPIQFSARIA